MPTFNQPTGIFKTDGTIGIAYGGADDSWTINLGVFVGSQSNVGIKSTFNDSTLINNGNIFSGSTFGVDFLGNNSVITNNAGHSIAGRSIGIDVGGDGATITNHGSVAGNSGPGIFFGGFSNHVVLNNDGEIYGVDKGVAASSLLEGGTINNSGLISSDRFGVEVFTNAGLITFIDNAASGTIKGIDAAILCELGRIDLNNRGTLTGGIDCNDADANDTVVNSGKINGEVHLGGGADVFNGNGGTSGAIFGEDGDDKLTGGGHKDTLVGGAGLDRLKGGGAADHFSFIALTNSVVGASRDVILDFSHKQHDKIDLASIDANANMGLDQAFHFIGSGHFHNRAGELRYVGHVLQGDIDADGVADFQIHVNAASLEKGDFIL
jgi:hypothetical protein